jgi:ankyrin repeat protein
VTVAELLAQADRTAPDGTRALLRALYRGQSDDARALVDADPDRVDIHEAAALGDALKIAMRVDFSWDRVDAFSADGFTALHLATLFGQFVALKILLDRKAPVNAVSRNPLAVTPLHAAVATAEENLAMALTAALLRAGADPDIRTADGFTALDIARQNGHVRLEHLLRVSVDRQIRPNRHR